MSSPMDPHSTENSTVSWMDQTFSLSIKKPSPRKRNSSSWRWYRTLHMFICAKFYFSPKFPQYSIYMMYASRSRMISSARVGLTILPWRTRRLLTMLLASSSSSPSTMPSTRERGGRTLLQHLSLSGNQGPSEIDISFDQFWISEILGVGSKSCSITQLKLCFDLTYMSCKTHSGSLWIFLTLEVC